MRSLSEKDMDVAVVRESLMISEADLWAAMTILSSAPVAPSVNFYAILPCNSCLGQSLERLGRYRIEFGKERRAARPLV